MRIIALCVCLLLVGCTRLVPAGAGNRPKLSLDDAGDNARKYIKKHDVTAAHLVKSGEDENAFYFYYILEHEKVAQPFLRTLRVDKLSGRVKVVNQSE